MTYTRRHTLALWLAATTATLAGPAAAHGPSHGSAAGSRPAAGTRPAEVQQKAWGRAGDPQAVQRTITIDMHDDMRFRPDRFEVREGETVRLRIRNRGRVLHELVLGDEQELATHAELMKRHPGMEHDEPYMAHVDPKRTGSIVWHFNRPGQFRFACLIPGHYDAGMIGTVIVQPR